MLTKNSTDNFAPKFAAKEWNASGAFHFYGSKKPQSYICEMVLTEEVDGTVLQKAVDKTLQRMPYYRYAFVRKKGLYYYADNELPFVVAESEKARTIGGATTNYHALDVTYFGNKISAAMFHALCDGFGLNRFIETMLYYYFCLKDGKEYDAEGIYTLETPYDPEEEKDAFEQKSKVSLKELKALADKEKRFHLPELADDSAPKVFRFPIKIKTDALLSWCKSYSTSPAAAVSAIMSQVVADENTIDEGVVMAVVPVSLRSFLHAEKTFKNCSSALFLPVRPDECSSMSAGELATQLRLKMKAQLNEHFGQVMAAAVNTVIHLGKKMPTFALKNKVLALKENNPQDTFTVDYIGTLKTSGYSDRIAEVNFLNPSPFNGSLMVMMYDCAGSFHFNINQTFEDAKYVKGFMKKLDELGISYEELPGDTFLNPEVELPKEQK